MCLAENDFKEIKPFSEMDVGETSQEVRER